VVQVDPKDGSFLVGGGGKMDLDRAPWANHKSASLEPVRKVSARVEKM
jgi:hypothetical protein